MHHHHRRTWALRDEHETDHDHDDDDDDDEHVPETQPPPPPETQPPQQPKRKTRKGKGKATVTETSANPSTGKAPCKTWSLTKEVELAKAWVEVSCDPGVVANYWGAIKGEFDRRMKYDVNVRSQDAIPTKVRGLIASVSKFACIYNNVSNTRRSGENDVIVLEKAKDRYHNEFGKSFPHEHAWRVVRDCPKFNPVLMVDPTKICAPTNKRSKTSETPTASPGESDARTNYMNVESDPPSQTERARPMGRNAARRAGSSSTTPASSDSISNIALIKCDRDLERYAYRVACRTTKKYRLQDIHDIARRARGYRVGGHVGRERTLTRKMGV